MGASMAFGLALANVGLVVGTANTSESSCVVWYWGRTSDSCWPVRS